MPKKLLVLLLSLLAALLLAEGAVRAVLSARGEPWDAARAEGEMDEVLGKMTAIVPETADGEAEEGADDEPGKGLRYVLHPYAGYSLQLSLGTIEGLVDAYAEGREDYTVFVMGGSVAAIFTGMRSGAAATLREGLAAHPAVAGRPVRIERLAIPGYKQPQQLTLLAYLMSRGCRPDLVINLDGLNEVRRGPLNAASDVPPTYPSVGHWGRVTAGDGLDPAGVELLVDVGIARRRAAAIVARARALGLARSAIFGRWTLSRLARASAEWSAAQEAWVAHLVEAGRGEASRPFGAVPGTDPAAALRESVDCWRESSRAMHRLCEPLGIRYAHFLQPTLHDEGSKPVTAEERRRGIGPRGFDRRVVEGYALLREGCARLAAEGVRCFDASGVFREVEETLYYDECHFGREGNELLARFMLAALEGEL